MKFIRNIGYAPLSAKERQIQDGHKYDKYFPAPNLRKTLLQRDGEVEDTIAKMRQIVIDYSWQVRDLCRDVLKASTIRQSVKNVYDFVYKYIKYQVEDGEKLRTPAYTWYEAQVQKRQHPGDDSLGADCDCMSIFCGCCFKEMQIPFSFRVTGYADRLGLCRGFQHVYTIAYDNGNEIICDPVYYEFGKEKKYEIQKTFPMSLNGTDIVMLSGLGDNDREYIEQPDGGLGELNGRKKRKAKKAARKEKKKARKQARKEKRAAKKAIRKAKKSGDKEALKKAKAAKKAAKKKIKANRTGIAKAMQKVGKGIARFTVATTMQLPRTMFCLLLRLNFRGLAKKLATNQKAREKFHKLWRNLGGKTKSWEKAVEKGKNKKALFGSKKLKGYTELQLQELGAVLEEWNYGHIGEYTLGDIFTEKQLGDLGFATTSVAAAIASATPIIKKVVEVLKEVGDHLPETADEAQSEGWDVEDVDDDYELQAEDGDIEESEQNVQIELPSDDSEAEEVEAEEIEEDEDEEEEEEDEDVEGLGDYGEILFVDSLSDNLGGVLGAGLFKKIASGVKKVVAKRKKKKAEKKAAKQTKKANKKAKKAAKKSAKKAKQTTKKTTKAEKKAAKKAAKSEKKATRQASKAARQEEREERRENGGGLVNRIKDAAQTETGQALVNTAKAYAAQKADELMEKYTNAPTPAPAPKPTNAQNGGSEQKKSLLAEHKGVVVVGSVLLFTLLGVGIYKATTSKPAPTPKMSGFGRLKALKLA